MTPEYLIPFAEQLATISGEIVSRYYRKLPITEQKEDLSPVTLADREVERALRALIHTTFPEHGIIGEEFGEDRPDAEYVWVVDPIDGTQSFMMGRPIFGTLIALCHRDEPVLGIIDQPILGERWTGVKGFATNFNNIPTRARACASLSEASLATTSPLCFSKSDKEKFDRVQQQARFTSFGGDCYSYGLIAAGLLDIVMEAGLKPYDFCALAPIIKGAGGQITDWQGAPVTRHSSGQILATSDKRVHAEALELLR